MKLPLVEGLLACSLTAPSGLSLASQHPAATTDPSPARLALDVRLFEARSVNPDREVLGDLQFPIRTDGRGVTASQWLATLAQRVPANFLAALALQTLPVEQGRARFLWRLRARSLQIDIHLDGPVPTGPFEAQIHAVLSGARGVLRQFHSSLRLELRRTTVLTSGELELPLPDYLSTFREFSDRDHRGQLYEALSGCSVFLLVTVTPKSLSGSELAQLTPVTLARPAGSRVPKLDNPLGVALQGTIVVGFEMSPSGRPVNPQILRSTLPEANPRILGEVSRWRWTPLQAGPRRRWAQVELHLEIPAP